MSYLMFTSNTTFYGFEKTKEVRWLLFFYLIQLQVTSGYKNVY